MPIVAECSQCQVHLRIPETKAGMLVRCPKCGQVFRAPTNQSQSPDQPIKNKPATGRLPSDSPSQVRRSERTGGGVPPVVQAVGDALTSDSPSRVRRGERTGGGFPPVVQAAGDNPPANSPNLSGQSSVANDNPPPVVAPAQLPRRKLKRKSNRNRLEAIGGAFSKVVAVIGLIVFVGMAGYFLLKYFALVGLPARAASELTTIFEDSAAAFESALQPQQRAQASQRLREQASKIDKWIQAYADKKDDERFIDAAWKRYKGRLEEADQRIERAARQLQNDETVGQDQDFVDAWNKWVSAYKRLEDASRPEWQRRAHQLRNPRIPPW